MGQHGRKRAPPRCRDARGAHRGRGELHALHRAAVAPVRHAAAACCGCAVAPRGRPQPPGKPRCGCGERLSGLLQVPTHRLSARMGGGGASRAELELTQEDDIRVQIARWGNCCQSFAIWWRGLRSSDLDQLQRRQKVCGLNRALPEGQASPRSRAHDVCITHAAPVLCRRRRSGATCSRTQNWSRRQVGCRACSARRWLTQWSSMSWTTQRSMEVSPGTRSSPRPRWRWRRRPCLRSLRRRPHHYRPRSRSRRSRRRPLSSPPRSPIRSHKSLSTHDRPSRAAAQRTVYTLRARAPEMGWRTTSSYTAVWSARARQHDRDGIRSSRHRIRRTARSTELQ